MNRRTYIYIYIYEFIEIFVGLAMIHKKLFLRNICFSQQRITQENIHTSVTHAMDEVYITLVVTKVCYIVVMTQYLVDETWLTRSNHRNQFHQRKKISFNQENSRMFKIEDQFSCALNTKVGDLYDSS